MNASELFTKIGILTVQNDMLTAELNQAKERIEELEAAASQPETANVEVTPKEK